MEEIRVDLKELEKFEKDIEKLKKELPTKYEKLLEDTGKMFMEEEAKEVSGFSKTGRLIDSFKMKRHKRYKEWILKKVEENTIAVGSETFYAEWVSGGHRQVLYKAMEDRKGNINRKRRRGAEEKVEYTEGNQFFDKGLVEAGKKIPGLVEKELFDAFGKTYGSE